MFSYIAPVA